VAAERRLDLGTHPAQLGQEAAVEEVEGRRQRVVGAALEAELARPVGGEQGRQQGLGDERRATGGADRAVEEAAADALRPELDPLRADLGAADLGVTGLGGDLRRGAGASGPGGGAGPGCSRPGPAGR
jgi:hypothetical protein